jgi:hypothetical protein
MALAETVSAPPLALGEGDSLGEALGTAVGKVLGTAVGIGAAVGDTEVG